MYLIFLSNFIMVWRETLHTKISLFRGKSQIIHVDKSCACEPFVAGSYPLQYSDPLNDLFFLDCTVDIVT